MLYLFGYKIQAFPALLVLSIGINMGMGGKSFRTFKVLYKSLEFPVNVCRGVVLTHLYLMDYSPYEMDESICQLTQSHSEQPKLNRVLAVLSALGLRHV